MKILVVYYSWSNGNTKGIADMVSRITGADTAGIETVVPYSGSYDEVVEQGQDEVNREYKPPIDPIGKDLSDYDLIFVGTPTWWYTMAPAMRSFLSGEEWNGRNVALFATNGGWPGHAIKDMEKICDGAHVVGSISIKFDSTGGSTMITSGSDVEEWISKCVVPEV